MIESFPLHWPIGYSRTNFRNKSRFAQTMGKAQSFLRAEIDRLGASDLIVSTNLRLRNDGQIYAADLAKRIDDPGVAIYFKYKGKSVSMCCDQYLYVWENIYALGKGIEALRGMDRWGVSDFIDRAFTGFAALPESTVINQKSIWEILGLRCMPGNEDAVHSNYRMKVKEVHPDVPGGTTEAFQELQDAYNKALSHFKK